MCIFLMNTTACRDDILVNIVKKQSTEITEIRLYPVEGPMPRASEAPFTLVDIVRCSKSWTTVDAGQCSQCSPTNGSPGRKRLAEVAQVAQEEDALTSSRGSLPKT